MLDILKTLDFNNSYYYQVFLLIAARFFGAMTIYPLFSSNLIPRMLRVLLSGFFALFVIPLYLNNPIKLSGVFVAILLIKEICVGALIGYIFSIPIWLVENVGNIIDIQRGEQFGAQIDPVTQNPSSSISKLLNQTFMVYLVSAGGLALFVKFVFFSFLTWSPIVYYIPIKALTVSLKLFANYFFWIVILALPVIFLLLVLDLVLGLLSSFVQQLNVTILAIPLKSALAILILLFYIDVIFKFSIERFMNENIFLFFKV